MRKKQLTMQQGLALGCLILLVCAVLFGIVLRATRSHDLEDPEKVAAAICDLPVDYQEERNAAAEMLDISTAVEQLQDRIPLQVEITGMQPTYNNLRYTAKVLKTTDREQAGNTVVLYLLMSMEAALRRRHRSAVGCRAQIPAVCPSYGIHGPVPTHPTLPRIPGHHRRHGHHAVQLLPGSHTNPPTANHAADLSAGYRIRLPGLFPRGVGPRQKIHCRHTEALRRNCKIT